MNKKSILFVCALALTPQQTFGAATPGAAAPAATTPASTTWTASMFNRFRDAVSTAAGYWPLGSTTTPPVGGAGEAPLPSSTAAPAPAPAATPAATAAAAAAAAPTPRAAAGSDVASERAARDAELAALGIGRGGVKARASAVATAGGAGGTSARPQGISDDLKALTARKLVDRDYTTPTPPAVATPAIPGASGAAAAAAAAAAPTPKLTDASRAALDALRTRKGGGAGGGAGGDAGAKEIVKLSDTGARSTESTDRLLAVKTDFFGVPQDELITILRDFLNSELRKANLSSGLVFTLKAKVAEMYSASAPFSERRDFTLTSRVDTMILQCLTGDNLIFGDVKLVIKLALYLFDNKEPLLAEYTRERLADSPVVETFLKTLECRLLVAAVLTSAATEPPFDVTLNDLLAHPQAGRLLEKTVTYGPAHGRIYSCCIALLQKVCIKAGFVKSK